MLQWKDRSKFRGARWILFPNGTRSSVSGTKHWVTDLEADCDCCDHNSDESDGCKVAHACGFLAWQKIQQKGGERFCYAAVDCGTGIQEKPGQGDKVDAEWDGHQLVEKAMEAGVCVCVCVRGCSRNWMKREDGQSLSA